MVNSYFITLLFLGFVGFFHTSYTHDNHINTQLVLSTSQHLTGSDILSQHSNINDGKKSIKQFTGGDTLAYVTPWNNKGYDIVKKFKGKFDYVSPVWYNIQSQQERFLITGEHDVDRSWMEQVKGKTASGDLVGKIVPRFQLEGWKLEDYQRFINDKKKAHQLIDLIMNQVKRYEYDGVVLEVGYPVALLYFLEHISRTLHEFNKELIIVLPPLRQEYQQMITADIYQHMATFVDRFSLMTYDYSSYRADGGPNAPIDWMMDNIIGLTNENNRHQLLLGINLYAMSYLPTRPPQPLVMNQVLERLAAPRDTLDDNETVINIEWDQESEEHWFEDQDEDGIIQGIIWMPTIKSLQRRIHLAEDYQVGLSLWEVGQGLDYFYDLF